MYDQALGICGLSKDYSTDAFLEVLRRFTSIRGWSRKLYSDNGSELVVASKELCQTISRLDWEPETV